MESPDIDPNIVKKIQKRSSIVLMHSEKYSKLKKLIPIYRKRYELTDSLLEAYNIWQDLTIIPPKLANEDHMKHFHDINYIKFIESIDPLNKQNKENFNSNNKRNRNEINDHENDNNNQIKNNNELEEYGLIDDCAVFPGLYLYIKAITGATLQAAHILCSKRAKIAINWQGGFHHAEYRRAKGFCYINDCVLAILLMKKVFSKILYIDLDIHHGDGVEKAFYLSNSVMTMSFHRKTCGFFPQTGDLEDNGIGKSYGYSINIPLKAGLSDSNMIYLFDNCFDEVIKYFNPNAIVLVNGSDILPNDPLGGFNLTFESTKHILGKILKLNISTLILGAGGYNPKNSAKYTLACTQYICGNHILDDTFIPEHEYFQEYFPNFLLNVEPNQYPDNNTKEELDNIINHIKTLLSENLNINIENNNDNDNDNNKDNNDNDDNNNNIKKIIK